MSGAGGAEKPRADLPDIISSVWRSPMDFKGFAT
jgi:hypothetical protein